MQNIGGAQSDMALPPFMFRRYFILGNEDGTDQSDGSIYSSYVDTYVPPSFHPPSQFSFYAYQHYFPDYPKENTVLDFTGSGYDTFDGATVFQIGWTVLVDATLTYPDNIKISYSPCAPEYDPTPNPNGTVGVYNFTKQDYPPNGARSIWPRWVDSTEYSYKDGNTFYMDTPQSGVVYSNANNWPWSYDISVDNGDSQVYNSCTNSIEYFPYTQATTELKSTCKLQLKGLLYSGSYCCWNKGTTVKGKVRFYSVDIVDGEIWPPPGYLKYTIGEDYQEESTADWEYTVDEDQEIDPIVIPKIAGRITFLNDFWITEITPPA